MYPIIIITKTYLYNFDPFKSHFYIVKLGFAGVYIIFVISAKNIDCGYSLEPPRRGGSNEYPQSMFWAEIWKISDIFIWKCSFFGCKIFNIFEWACFRNVMFSCQNVSDIFGGLFQISFSIEIVTNAHTRCKWM